MKKKKIGKKEIRFIFKILLFLFGITLMIIAPLDYKLFGLIYVVLSMN